MNWDYRSGGGGAAVGGWSRWGQGGEEVSTCEHVKCKNSGICRDFGPVEDVCKGPLCCLSCGG